MLNCEKYNIPCEPIHAGELFKEDYLEPLGLTVTETAKKLGITRKTLSEFINGRLGVSPKMAIKLSKAFNTSPQLWLGLQMDYDLYNTLKNYEAEDVEVIWQGENLADAKLAC